MSDCPGRINVPEIPFARWIAETEDPVRLAMAESESPDLTTYLTEAGLGFGLALTTALGFGFGLEAVDAEELLVGFGFGVIWVVEITGAGLVLPPETIGTAFEGG